MAINSTYLDDLVTTVVADCDFIAFVADYAKPTATTDIQDSGVNQLGRVVPTSVTSSGTKITVTSTINTSTANPLDTTVSSASSTTVFDLTSVTGLTVGDRLEITLSTGTEDREIDSISTNTITVTKAYSSAPAVSDVARGKISAVHIIKGGTIGGVDGATLAAFQTVLFKANTEEKTFTHTIDLIGN
jgi:hypothetical protein|tara:strand:- start:87 stop:650 length:564 start_codon:yes stop_codon:yes gene_type:complete